jgi:hypothetical protein
MNSILFFALLCSIRIPVEFESRIALFRYIVPSDSIICWKAGLFDIQYKRSMDYYSTSNFNPLDSIQLNDENTYNSFYVSTYPLKEYLIYKKTNGTIFKVKDISELRNFIGQVQNLPEALLLASTYGYFPAENKNLGSYNLTKKGYFLKLIESKGYTDALETTYLNKNGKEIKSKPDFKRILITKNGDVFKIIKGKYTVLEKMED